MVSILKEKRKIMEGVLELFLKIKFSMKGIYYLIGLMDKGNK